MADAGAAANNDKKMVIFKNCASFTDWISKIKNTNIDNAKDLDDFMPLYNLIEYNDNDSKTSGSLWQYYRDEPALTDACIINNFPTNSVSFNI